MLDAVIPTAKYIFANISYDTNSINAYLDINATNAGVAFLNGIVARLDNGLWKPIDDLTKVLSGDFKVQVNATNIGGVSSNGLIYDNCEGGSNPWSFAISYCSSKSMGLPDLNEIGYEGYRVSACSTYTWTRNQYGSESSGYVWQGTNPYNFSTGNGGSYNRNTRCVR